MNKYQKGLVVGLIIFGLMVVGAAGYYFLNKHSNKSVNQEQSSIKYNNISFEKNNNSEKGEKTSSSYWDRMVVGVDQNGKANIIIKSIVGDFGKELRGDAVVFTFIPESQTVYFYTEIDGTDMESQCYSLNVSSHEMKQLNYECFDDYTGNHIISPDGSKVAYEFSYGAIYLIDITNGYKKEIAVASSDEIFYKGENDANFKWIDNSIFQYPVYNKKLELIGIKTAKVDFSDITTSIKFLAPVAGEKISIGSNYNIKWIANGSDNIKVLEILSGDFSDDGAGYRPSFIGKGYPVVNVSEGSYQVIIPESPLFPLENGYRVYIRTNNTEAYSDVFSIVPRGQKEIGPSSVWSNFQESLGKWPTCYDSECVYKTMEQFGASSDAVAFSRLLPERGFLDEFTEMGRVDLGEVTFIGRVNSMQQYYLINSSSTLIPVEIKDTSSLDWTKDKLYLEMKNKHPNVTLFGSSSNFDKKEVLPNGNERYIFTYRFINGCRSCTTEYSANIGFDFDSKGTFLNKIFLEITK